MPVTPEKTIEILVTCVENCGLAGYDELAGRLRASIAAALLDAEACGAARERERICALFQQFGPPVDYTADMILRAIYGGMP